MREQTRSFKPPDVYVGIWDTSTQFSATDKYPAHWLSSSSQGLLFPNRRPVGVETAGLRFRYLEDDNMMMRATSIGSMPFRRMSQLEQALPWPKGTIVLHTDAKPRLTAERLTYELATISLLVISLAVDATLDAADHGAINQRKNFIVHSPDFLIGNNRR